MTYVLAKSNNSSIFVEKCNELLRSGATPIGGVALSYCEGDMHPMFAQAFLVQESQETSK